MNILVSACLLGDAVRYNGKSKLIPGIDSLAETHKLFKLCPEVAGGLPVPREAAEIKGKASLILSRVEGGIFTKTGGDVTEQFLQGARKTLAFCLEHRIEAAILKARSPSCGLDAVYDGSHSGRLIKGEGITAALLRQNGIKIYTEDNFRELETVIEKQLEEQKYTEKN